MKTMKTIGISINKDKAVMRLLYNWNFYHGLIEFLYSDGSQDSALYMIKFVFIVILFMTILWRLPALLPVNYTEALGFGYKSLS